MTCMVHMAGRRSRREVLEGNTEFSDAELRLVIHEEVPNEEVLVQAGEKRGSFYGRGGNILIYC